MPNRPAGDRRAQAGPPRPGRGIDGRLDTPSDSVAPNVRIHVGGWVAHPDFPVRTVLVAVDDVPVATARVDVPRPDIQARWPRLAGDGLHGWSVHLPPLSGSVVTISVYAHVDTGEGDGSRLGPWVRFVETTLPVVATPESFGEIADPGDVAPGVLLVRGTASAPAGLSRVEVAVDDGGWVRARHSIPTADGSPVGGFSAHVGPLAPGVTTLRAVAVGVDGRRHELAPATATVVDEADGSATPERRRVLAERFVSRVEHIPRAADRPRILVAAHSLDLGGAQLYLQLLVDALRERGFDLCVASRSAGRLQAGLETAGIPVLVYGAHPSDREAVEGQMLQVAEFAVENGVVGCLANSLPSFPAVAAAQRLGLPTSWAIHESFDVHAFLAETYGRLPGDVVAVATDALAAADEVVFEAGATSDLYADLVPADRRRVVPYGVELDAIDAWRSTAERAACRADLGLDPDALVLACVGTVEARKGQLALLRAFARIPAQRRWGVQLAVVGMGDSSYADGVRRFVDSSGLADAVVLVDVTPDIHPCYLAADVLVSASDIESVPRTMLEAMALGRPVAAAAAFGVGELVIDGETGFLCEPLDLKALQVMLERVIATDRSRLAALGEAARHLVASRHDPAGYVDHFTAVLTGWTSPSS